MIDIPLPTHKESESWGDYEAFNSGSVEKEVGEILYSFTRILKPNHILDLGTHKGISAAYMALACRDNGKGLVHTVEYDSAHWEDATNLWNKMGVHDNIFQYQMDVETFSKSQIEEYELMLIDTEPAQRWGELEKFYPNLLPGGYVFLHDLPRGFCKGNINPDHPEMKDWPWGSVPKMIKDLIKDRELIPFHLPNPRSMAGFYKARADDYKITS